MEKKIIRFSLTQIFVKLEIVFIQNNGKLPLQTCQENKVTVKCKLEHSLLADRSRCHRTDALHNVNEGHQQLDTRYRNVPHAAGKGVGLNTLHFKAYLKKSRLNTIVLLEMFKIVFNRTPIHY